MQKHLLTLLKFGISIAILSYLFHQANQEEQFQNLYSSEKKWGWVGVAIFGCIAAHVVSYYRWHIMAKAVGFSLSIWEAIKIGFIGSFFNVLAFGVVGGDSLRAFYAARQTKTKVPEAISSVFADRIIGLMTMFGIAIVAFNLKDFSDEASLHENKLALIQYAMRVATILFCAGLAGFVILFLTPTIRETKLFKWLEGIRIFGPILSRVMDVMNLYRKRPTAILSCVGLSLITNTFFAITIYAIASGFVSSFPSFPNHFIIAPISLVANAVPLPGGLGGMEFALSFLYEGFSHSASPSENGFVVALGFRFALLLISVIGSGFWFAYKRETSSIVEPGAAAAS